LSIDLTQDLNAVSIITYISYFVGFVVYDSTLILNIFYSNKFQNTWTSVKTAQYNSLVSSNIPQLHYKQNRMHLFVTWSAGTKKPQDLNNASFFYQGKVRNI